MRDDWRYHEIIRRCSPYLLENYNIRCQVDDLVMHMCICGHVSDIERQYIHETTHTLNKMTQLLNCLTDSKHENMARLFEDLVDGLSRDEQRDDIPKKVLTTRDEVMKMSESPHRQETVYELLNNLHDNYMYLSNIQILQSLKFLKDNIQGAQLSDCKRRLGDKKFRDISDMRTGNRIKEDDEDDKNTELMKACLRNDHAAVMMLLNKGDIIRNINDVNSKKQTALILACKKGEASIVGLLLRCRLIDVNVQDTYGCTALMYGVMNGDHEVVSVLLKSGRADLSVSNKGLNYVWYIFGSNAARRLMFEIRLVNTRMELEKTFEENISEIKKQLENNTDWERIKKVIVVLLQFAANPFDLLEAAMLLGTESIVTTIINSGKIEINMKNIMELITTAINGCTSKMFQVITSEISLNFNDLKSYECNSIVKSAIRRNNPKISEIVIQLLTQAPVDRALQMVLSFQTMKINALSILLDTYDASNFNIRDNDGNTVFMIMCRYCSKELVSLLLDLEGIDFEARNEMDQTAFMLSLLNRTQGVAETLLQSMSVDVKVNDCGIFGVNNLMYACKMGNMDVTAALLSQEDVDINAADVFGNTALMYACSGDNSEIVSLLLQMDGIDVRSVDEDGMTALLYSCWSNNSGAVSLLLKRMDVDVNAKNTIKKFGTEGMTALMYACQAGSSEVVALLLADTRVDMNAAVRGGTTAFMYACQGNNPEVVSQLLAHETVAVNLVDDLGMSAFTSACLGTSADIVQVLLRNPQIDVNILTDVRETALMLVCKSERTNLDIVTALLDSGKIDVNATSDNGMTAFMYACNSGDVKLVTLLQTVSGLRTDVADDFGKTPFMYACSGPNSELVDILLHTGVDINAATTTGKTALMFACDAGNDKTVAILLNEPTVDINKTDNYGTTALMYACTSKKRDTKTVLLLLKHRKLLVNLKDKFGKTALMHACKVNSEATGTAVKSLLRFPSIDINAICQEGMTALMYASKYGNVEINHALLRHTKLKVNGADKDGMTAFMHACMLGRNDIVSAFLELSSSLNVEITSRNNKNAFMLACENHKASVACTLLNSGKMDLYAKDKSGKTIRMYISEMRNADVSRALIQAESSA